MVGVDFLFLHTWTGKHLPRWMYIVPVPVTNVLSHFPWVEDRLISEGLIGLIAFLQIRPVLQHHPIGLVSYRQLPSATAC